MMYAIRPSTRFQKDLKRIQKRGYDLALLTAVIKKLPEKSSRPRTTTTSLWVITAAAGSVTLPRIGFWSMRSTATS